MSVITDPSSSLPIGDPQSPPLIRIPSPETLSRALQSLILSASGWRGVFVQSADETDPDTGVADSHLVLAVLMADTYGAYMSERGGKKIALGIDARPTGPVLADCMLRVLTGRGLEIEYLFITAAPEIMAYSKNLDGFVYISASHNPIGHNGVKFGSNDGGVLPASETTRLIEDFVSRASRTDAGEYALSLISKPDPKEIERIFRAVPACKERALAAYRSFTHEVAANSADTDEQKELFSQLKTSFSETPITLVCDMNGSARSLSIDASFAKDSGLDFYAINNRPGHIVHGIIPELENLQFCAEAIEKLRSGAIAYPGGKYAALGYMPDCDGDRGNIIFWNERTQRAEILKAQEVFALSVLSELAYVYRRAHYGHKASHKGSAPLALAVNDASSLRIELIAKVFNARVARAEVGETNVVHLARELRSEGYEVRILGEGSNGGTITHPAAVRDPLNTVSALIKLLALRDTDKPGLFRLWCELSGQEYRENFSLCDIIASLPAYTTTNLSEKRALLHIRTADHGLLKKEFQRLFLKDWEAKRSELASRFGIVSWEAAGYTGTKETRPLADFGQSGRGGLKILFQNAEKKDIAAIWMRGSGTEAVFRIMSEMQGIEPEAEAFFLSWETELLLKADAAITPEGDGHCR